METNKRIKITVLALLAVIALWLVIRYVAYPLVEKSVRQNEVGECIKLERQSRETKELLTVGEDGQTTTLFYITAWQSDMCKANGFELDARIQN